MAYPPFFHFLLMLMTAKKSFKIKSLNQRKTMIFPL